jgi:competence protein ComEA
MHYGDAMARRSLAIRLILSSLLLSIVFSTVVLSATKKPPLKPVNINTATSEELQQVPGIGPATAEKILQMRKSYGLFKSVDDLLAIKGIGKKRLDKMRKYLTVGKPAAASKTPPPKTQSKEPATPTEQPPPPNQP